MAYVILFVMIILGCGVALLNYDLVSHFKSFDDDSEWEDEVDNEDENNQ